MGIENRKTPRYPYRAALEILTTKGVATTETARAVNLSTGGVCFEHPVAIGPNAKVRIRFAAPEPFDVTAEVRHATRVSTEVGGMELDPIWLVGAQFTNVDYAQQRRLEAMMAALIAAAAGREMPGDDEDL
ncbi:MAG TPA: PilZ domain-containing protein [Polyangia bacterium]|jgi:hypothetical protein|nr:PilZ domain-containing protein [Polyangia bacterium]